MCKNNNHIQLEGFVALSLFDGCSGGQQAIERLGIKDNYTYISSEVDKYAMQATRYNFPNTIFIGSVTEITIEKYSDTEMLLNNKYIIDSRFLILIGGSPCQGFSFAGKQKGASTKCNIEITTLEQYLKLKEQQFEFNGQSYLFWEYIRIKQSLKNINPELIFLLENVKMTKKWQGMFDKAVGGKPVEINSSLVSAQNRKRLYWSNLEDRISQPENKGIYLKDILELDFSLSINKANCIVDREKSYCIDANYWKGGNLKNYFEKSRRQLVFKPNPSFSKDGLCHIANADIRGNDSIKRIYHPEGKGPALTTCGGGHREPKVLCGNISKKEFP